VSAPPDRTPGDGRGDVHGGVRDDGRDAALLARVDHLVYATPDVDATVDELARRTGVRATPGGPHPGRGTRNALLALGPTSYLEIVGPDAAQPAPAAPRWLSVDAVDAPRLVTWAARVDDLDAVAARARTLGLGGSSAARGSGPTGRCSPGASPTRAWWWPAASCRS
jgi:hypothetical protein